MQRFVRLVCENNMWNQSYIGARLDVVRLVPTEAQRVLDVGCSIGSLGRAIKERQNAFVIGIERDADMAAEARNHLDHVYHGSAEDSNLLPQIETESLDCIIFADILEHLSDPWACLQNLGGYLRPGGSVVISIPNVQHYTTLVNLTLRGTWPRRDRGLFDGTHLRWFTRRDVVEMLETNNVTISRLERKYRIFDAPGKKINRLAKYAALPGLRDFLTYQFLVVGTKQPPITE